MTVTSASRSLDWLLFGLQQGARRIATAGLLALLPFMLVGLIPMAQADAQSAFAAGQTAFKSGDFPTAASFFDQALKEGHARGPAAYNLGVAHYRAQNYTAAEAAFLAASNDPTFAPTAFYNLGLVAKRLGNHREARIWFSQAQRHNLSSPRLQRLAEKAQRSLPAEAQATSQRSVARLLRPQKPTLAEHMRVTMQTGYGTDSNVYRSPSASYVDLGDPANPSVDPVVQSGTYIPIDATSEIRWGTREDSYFKVHYDFAGRFYTDKDLKNGNEIRQRVYVGGVLDQDTARGSRYWSSRFVVERHEQDAFDRDTGTAQLAGTEDITDRLNYTKLGPRVYYERELGKFGWGFRGSAYIRNFDETLDYLDLTQEQYQAGVHVSYRPWQNTKIRVLGDATKRNYASRVAKGVDGIRFNDNDLLVYDYVTAGITVKQRLSQSFSATFDFRYSERTDLYAAYDDYSRYTGRISVDMRRGRLKAYAAYSYRSYDFPNAFIFDDPLLDLRTLDSTFIALEANYYFTDHLGVHASIEKDLVESNDPRSQYDRMLASLSMHWRL